MLLISCSFGGRPPKDVSVPVVTEPTPTQPSLPAPGAGEPVLEPSPEPIEEPKEIVDEGKKEFVDIKVNIKYFGSAATVARKAKYDRAISLFRKVVGLKAFRTAVINHKYQGKVQFASTNDSTAMVYKKLLEGAETLQPEKDGEVDMEVEFYYANNSTVGYTYPNVKRIWVNTKFFDGYSLSSVAANLIHEWLHKLGYGHDSSATSRRPYSVPYGVGSIMRTLGKEYEKDF